MVEFTKSNSGHWIAKVEGRTTASLRDPILEADRWIKRNQDRIEFCKTVIVLGIGSGFHIEKLAAEYPDKKIVALEFCKPLASKDFNCKNVVAGHCDGDPFALPCVVTAVKESYSVLLFAPAFLGQANFYQKLCDDLNGRSPDGLFKLVQTRWGTESSGKVRALLALDEDQGIHYKHFVDLIEQHPTLPTEEQYLGLALGELFK